MQPSDRVELDPPVLVELVPGGSGAQVDQVGQELVERRVEQPDGDRETVHRREHGLEVGDLRPLEFGQRRGLGRLVVAQNEAAHDRQPVGSQEHVLGAAQADATRTVLAPLSGVTFGVGVGSDLDVAGRDDIRPRQEGVEFGRWLGARGRQQAGVDRSAAAVDRDLVTGPHRVVSDRDRVTVDHDLRRTDHRRDAPAACHDGGMAHEPATHGQDTLRGLHAQHVVGRRLLPEKDGRLAAISRGDRVVGGQHDSTARRARGCRQALTDGRRTALGGQARVEERLQVVGVDAMESRRDGEPVAGTDRVVNGGRDRRGQFARHGPRR